MQEENQIKNNSNKGNASKDKKEEINERRKKVAILYGRKPTKEIAKKLGVSVYTILNDIKFLRKKGIIKNASKTREKEKKRIAKRREKVVISYGKKSTKEIAEELGVSVSTIVLDISFLRSKGILKNGGKTREKEKEEIKARREKVASLYGKKSAKEIAGEVGVSVYTILNDIKFLKQEESKKYLPERKYKAMMIEKIKDFYRKGDIENSIKYLDMLQQEVPFTEEEKERFQKIMEQLEAQRERMRRRIETQDLESEEER